MTEPTQDELAVLQQCEMALHDIPEPARGRMSATLYNRLMGEGRAVYGPLDLATETRNFRVEAGQEAADQLHYTAAEAVEALRQGRAIPDEIEALNLIARAWYLLGGVA